MKATTSRAFRQRYINTYSYADFDNFEDFFLYLHLNQNVLWLHFVGAFVAIPLLPWALYQACYQQSFWPLLLYLGLYYGFGFSSHWLCDGQISRTTPDYVPSYVYVINLNFRMLTGKIKAYEDNYRQKYPHTLWVYDASLTPPAWVRESRS